MSKDSWTGVDFDGTFAEYHGWAGPFEFGPPVPEMLARVKRWLKKGRRVKIFTARASDPDPELRPQIVAKIQDYTEEHVGRRLEVTYEKDYHCVQYWDDRAVQVVPNEGTPYVHPDYKWITEHLVENLVKHHPLPWKIEKDWTWKVLDRDGGEVIKCQTQDQADILMRAVGIYQVHQENHAKGK